MTNDLYLQQEYFTKIAVLKWTALLLVNYAVQ